MPTEQNMVTSQKKRAKSPEFARRGHQLISVPATATRSLDLVLQLVWNAERAGMLNIVDPGNNFAFDVHHI